MSDTTHEAPERIWAFEPDIFDNCSVWQDAPSPAGDAIEYVRADLVGERSDEVQAAVAAALREAAKQAAEWGAIVDHPNVYMGGPSRNAQRIAQGFAERILALIPEDYV